MLINQSTIKLIKNPEFYKRTKHIDIKFHFSREKVEKYELDIEYVCSNNQLANLLMKALPRDRFNTIKSFVFSISTQTVGVLKTKVYLLH